MSRLPAALRPLWPVFKRAHRLSSVVLGVVYRRLSPLLGRRGVPTRAAVSSAAAAQRGELVLHPGGPAETILRPVPEGDPSEHWRFVAAQRSTVSARYVVEVRGGSLIGEFGATVTPGKLLDYETSGYFGLRSWREHPLFLSPTIGRVHDVAGDVVSLTTRGTAVNYYHFLYDAIARYGIVEEALPGLVPSAVVVPHRTRYQRELLALAGIEAPLIEPAPRTSVRAERLLVPSTPNQDLDAPAWSVEWLRNRLRPGAPSPLGPRLYLTRGDRPNTRRYVQEPELWPWLESQGFVQVDPGAFSVQQQIDIFHDAEIVVGPHGAALTNITFCGPGTRVLELFAPTYVHLGLWSIAAALGHVEYRYMVGAGDHRPGRPMTGNYDDVVIPAARVRAAVQQLLD